MTESEAIEILKYYDKQPWFLSGDQPAAVAFKLAIQALEEVQAYRAIGTIERFHELTEKAEPKKAIPNRPLQEGAYIKWTCPNCGKMRWSGYYHPPLTFDRVCTNCLQAIDWE